MAVTQYIGARYVPKLADPIEWASTLSYEPLTIVTHQGDSYTSRQAVPKGIDIGNEDYWAATGNYDAQIEAYRKEVKTFDSRITANTEGVSENKTAISELETSVSDIDARVTTNTTNIAKNTTGVSENKTAITSLTGSVWTESMPYTGKNVVFFGDSYMQENIPNSNYGYVPTRIATELGMTKFNYSVAGAGWARKSNQIATQQTTAASAMTDTQKANTSLVVAVCGCNDLLNMDTESEEIDRQTIINGITSFVTFTKTTYPNARVIIVPFNFGFGGFNTARNILVHNTLNSLHTVDLGRMVTIIPYAWTWNIGLTSRFQNSVHPNQLGYNTYVTHIMNNIYGNKDTCDFGPANSVTFTTTYISDSYRCAYLVDKGIVNISGFIRPLQSYTGKSGALEIRSADYAVPVLTNVKTSAEDDGFNIFPLTDTNGYAVGSIYFRNDGSIHAYFVDVTANAVCNFNGSFPVQVGVEWSA